MADLGDFWKPPKGMVAQKKKPQAKKKKAKKRKRKNVQKQWKQKRFYKSWEWKRVRYEILCHYGAECMLCHSTENIVVDHIISVRKRPDLALDPDNLQVLCNSCNMGKSWDDEKDFRPSEMAAPRNWDELKIALEADKRI